MGQSSRIWVAELGGDEKEVWPYGLTLRVGVTVGDPEVRVQTLGKSKRSIYREIAPHVVRSRPDLSGDIDYPDVDAARSAKDALIRTLRAKGHRVNGVGEIYRVYVIELDSDLGPKQGDTKKPWLYVGETSLTPEARIEQHRVAYRNAKGPLHSKTAFKHFVRGRPDLYRGIAPVHTRKESKRLEKRTVNSLMHRGFSVWWG